LSDFSEFFQDKAEWHADKGHMTKSANFENPRWRTAAILKIVKSPYRSKKSSDFDEIWCVEANSDKAGSHFTQIPNFRNSRLRFSK